jgi:hypothetical protein
MDEKVPGNSVPDKLAERCERAADPVLCASAGHEEVPVGIVGGLDIHRRQITFDYLDTATGELSRGEIVPADREHSGRGWRASKSSAT